MGCRESIFVDESIIDFPIFLLFFNRMFPIFPIFSILSFLFSYFFEQPWRWTPCQMFCMNNKMHFSLANANNSASLERNMVKITGFAHSQTTNKLVNKAANDSARVSWQDRKKLPALGNNQIAGVGEFCPVASLEKMIIYMF